MQSRSCSTIIPRGEIHQQFSAATVCPYLAEVPRTCTNLLLRAVVDPPRVVQDVLLPLVFVIQKHGVLCGDTAASRL